MGQKGKRAGDSDRESEREREKANESGNANANGTAAQSAGRGGYAGIAAVYLLGLFVGGLYIGMVIPARTVVQQSFGIDSSTGIWMINIYTLFYAALIPVIGKLADRHGRKAVYLWCVCVFALGAAACGVSAQVGGFSLLLAGRVLQACGAGGMIPVANAAMGTAFPPEKRGMALGLAAAVVGISNVLGSVAGSAVLGLAGPGNWGMLFYVCIPVCLAVIAMAVAFLPSGRPQARGGMDVAGSFLFVVVIMSLLLGIREVDFSDIGGTLLAPVPLASLAVAVVAAFAFVQVERRADDPMMHLGYARVRAVRLTMGVSFLIGCVVTSMTVIPETIEFALGLPAGDGGYYLAAIGVFSIVGPPFAGRIIDKLGPKPVLLFGLVTMALGYALFAAMLGVAPTPLAVVVALCVIGLGMGFAMGAPTNYMILANTRPEDSTSAVASVALVRQVGNSLAPSIFVGFTAGAASMAGHQASLACVVAFDVLACILTAAYRDNAARPQGPGATA